MLLANKLAIKSGFLLSAKDNHQSYKNATTLPISINKKNLAEKLHNVLVTHVRADTGLIFVQFIEDSRVNKILDEMQTEFRKCYASPDHVGKHANEDKKFSPNFLKDILKRNHAKNVATDAKFSVQFLNSILKRNFHEACVCRLRGRYYRCKLLKEVFAEDSSLAEYYVHAIDYGFSFHVKLDDMFRPMIRYLDVEPLAFKLELAITCDNNMREVILKIC